MPGPTSLVWRITKKKKQPQEYDLLTRWISYYRLIFRVYIKLSRAHVACSHTVQTSRLEVNVMFNLECLLWTSIVRPLRHWERQSAQIYSKQDNFVQLLHLRFNDLQHINTNILWFTTIKKGLWGVWNCHMKKQTVSQVRYSPDITQDQKR